MEPHHTKGMDLASTSIMHVSKLTLSVLSVHAIKPNQCVLSDTFKVAHQQQAACKSEEDSFMLKGTTHKIEAETRMKAGIELPHGFRFHPTDEELVNYYLCRRCAGQPIAAPIIKEVDLYKFDPWHLPEIGFYGEKEWYFFSPRNRKYPNGSRPNRAAGSGYWKATGADKPIGKPKTLGIKKALVFYAGKAPNGVKTNWIMHEYRLANVDRYASKKNNNNLRLDDWVLCRIYNKKGKIEKYNIGAPKMNTEVVHNIEHEKETKPEIHKLGNEELYAETSDSVPRFHTDSSSSEQMVSPEREVESDPKRNDMALQLENEFEFQFNYLDNNNLSLDDPFGTVQYQMGQQCLLEDMFMYLQKPFSFDNKTF